jgi:DNA polymerase family A
MSSEELERTVMFRKEVKRKIEGHSVKDYVLIPESERDSYDEEEQAKLRPIKLPVYDEHFIQHLGEEHCIRPTCEGCRYINSCQHTFERLDLSGASNIRRAFIARDGYSIAAIDYSGIELRVAANIAQEDVWINAFLGGKDIHEETARAIFQEAYEIDSKFKRKLAKCVTADTVIKIQFNSGTTIDIPIGVLFQNLPEDEEDRFFSAPMNLNVINEFGEAKRVDKLYYGGERDTVRLDFEDGKHIEGSFVHRLRVIDASGAYVWKNMDEITEEDLVVTYSQGR